MTTNNPAPDEEEEPEEEEEAPAGRLAGPGEAKAHMRAYYFSHRRYQRLSDHHQGRIEEAKSKRDPVRDTVDPRGRNNAARREYEIAMREWEQRRIEREDAKQEWAALRADILAHGGIKAGEVGEDYRDIPRDLRRKDGEHLDNMATFWGYGYQDDFVKHVAGVHERSRQPAPKRPEKPTYEDAKGWRGVMPGHGATPEQRAKWDEVQQMQTLLRAARAEIPVTDPAYLDLKAAYKEILDDYERAA